MTYAFEEIDPSLPVAPYAARRALDRAGVRVSAAAWKALPLAVKREIASLGAELQVDARRVRQVLARAKVRCETVAPRKDPRVDGVPARLCRELGFEVEPSIWRALSPLDRYALARIATRAPRERIERAYNEIVLVPEPAPPLSTHLSSRGEVHMVDVGAKATTERRAVAEARVTMDPATAARLRDGKASKGDVLATARIAGIQGAKKTPELIPLCHAVALTKVEILLTIEPRGVVVRATAEATDRTGVEMEAMVAASTAALTVYDMLKGVDRGMSFEVRLLEKSGGRSGLWTRRAP